MLIFASLAVLLLYKGYETFVEPHTAIAKAQRITNSTAPSKAHSDFLDQVCATQHLLCTGAPELCVTCVHNLSTLSDGAHTP